MAEGPLVYAHSSFHGLIGVGRRDITPPVGIYARSWGAATHDVALGVHRPLTATALALWAQHGTTPFILLALDLGWWATAGDDWAVRGRVLEALGLDQSRLLINLSHTHAGPSTSVRDADKPGGALIRPYVDAVAYAAATAAREAIATSEEATLTWATGRCALARNRDLFTGDRHVCGFNPDAPADETLLVGRVTNNAGTLCATIVNYACHPTTLAWENQAISPDYVGAMRDLVERQTGLAPCLFLQGASGELAPRDQYTGDPAVADQNGRMLAYAVLSTLEGALPPAMQIEYAGTVESGAPLATWRRTPRAASSVLRAARVEVELELKELPPFAELQRRWKDVPAHVLEERLSRAHRVRQGLGGGPTSRVSLWLWRVGDAVVAGHANEAYSLFQTALRRCFADRAVVVMNLTSGPSSGYLPPADRYDHEDLYEVWQSPFARGSLERLLDAAKEGIAARLFCQGEG